MIIFAVALTAMVATSGYVLSTFKALSAPNAWLIASLGALGMAGIPAYRTLRRRLSISQMKGLLSRQSINFAASKLPVRVLLVLLAMTACLPALQICHPGGSLLVSTIALAGVLLLGCFVGPATVAVDAEGCLSSTPVNASGKTWLRRHFLGALFLVVISFLLLAQIAVAVFFLPSNHDSFTCYLPRVAQYLQQGSLDFYISNYIAQTVHFKGAAVCHLFLFRMFDAWDQSPQLFSVFCWFLAVVSAYRISWCIWKSRLCGLLAASLAASVVSGLMIGTTPQIDIPITLFILATIALLFSAVEQKKPVLMVGAMAATCLALTVKASAILWMPPLAIIYAASLFQMRKVISRFHLAALIGSGVILTVILVLPSGYLENQMRYGHIMGPADWRAEHTMDQVPKAEKVSETVRNAGRYLVHLVGLDGWKSHRGSRYSSDKGKSTPYQADIALKDTIVSMFDSGGINLRDETFTRVPFSTVYQPPHEDMSFCGPLFLLLIVPGVIVCFFVKRARTWMTWTMLAAAVLYFILQSSLSVYDPWRGRSFTTFFMLLACLVPAIPVGMARIPSEMFRVPSQCILASAVGVVLIFGLHAAFYRLNSPLFLSAQNTWRETAHPFDAVGDQRIRSMCPTQPEYAERYIRLESLLPRDVTLFVHPSVSQIYSYFLYGTRANRKVIFSEDQRDVGYYLFPEPTEIPRPGDVSLDEDFIVPYPGHSGQKLWLRKTDNESIPGN